MVNWIISSHDRVEMLIVEQMIVVSGHSSLPLDGAPVAYTVISIVPCRQRRS